MSAVSIRKLKRIRAKLDRDIVRESNGVKLLGIILNNKLKFDKHVSNICSKVNRTKQFESKQLEYLKDRRWLGEYHINIK